MAMKFRIYRKVRHFITKAERWEYVCSGKGKCKDDVMYMFNKWSGNRFGNEEMRVEDARYFGYYVED